MHTEAINAKVSDTIIKPAIRASYSPATSGICWLRLTAMVRVGNIRVTIGRRIADLPPVTAIGVQIVRTAPQCTLVPRIPIFRPRLQIVDTPCTPTSSSKMVIGGCTVNQYLGTSYKYKQIRVGL